MPRPALDSAATRALISQVDKQATGYLMLPGGSHLTAYLLRGEIVAADRVDEPEHLLRRLDVSGVLTRQQVATLRNMMHAGEPIFGMVLELIHDDDLEEVLYERFRENLTEFLGRTDRPVFTELGAVFVDNLQLGHDTVALIRECAADYDLAATLDPDAPIRPGRRRPRDDDDAYVLEVLGNSGVHTVASLVERLPIEPLAGRALLAPMIDEGILRLLDAPVAPSPAPSTPSPPAGPAPDQPAPILGPPPALTEQPVPELGIELTEDNGGPPVPTKHAGNLSSLTAWLGQTTEDEDIPWGAFEDNEKHRGAGSIEAEGSFTTESHHLDRVEFVDIEEEPMSTEERARFGAPMLSTQDAKDKVIIANQVLSVVATAFDQTHGAGRGSASLQLLVESATSRFAPLFTSVQTAKDGALPVSTVLDNLARRPTSEHRRLLNDGLVDLIERALSTAADDLPDETIDQVLEKVAGYRHRMGL